MIFAFLFSLLLLLWLHYKVLESFKNIGYKIFKQFQRIQKTYKNWNFFIVLGVILDTFQNTLRYYLGS